MRITFVRHGETEENKKDIRQGQSLGTLSPLGKEQAKKVAERLKDEQFDITYVSDLQRTKDTAAAILSHHQYLKTIYTPEIRERSSGVFEGKLKQEYRQARREHRQPFAEFKPKGGESILEVQDRMVTFFNKLTKEAWKEVLIVSHAAAMSLLFLDILEERLTIDHFHKYQMHNAAISIVEVKDGKAKIVVFDDYRHLL